LPTLLGIGADQALLGCIVLEQLTELSATAVQP
jgi:hypothetical protein